MCVRCQHHHEHFLRYQWHWSIRLWTAVAARSLSWWCPHICQSIRRKPEDALPMNPCTTHPTSHCRFWCQLIRESSLNRKDQGKQLPQHLWRAFGIPSGWRFLLLTDCCWVHSPLQALPPHMISDTGNSFLIAGLLYPFKKANSLHEAVIVFFWFFLCSLTRN